MNDKFYEYVVKCNAGDHNTDIGNTGSFNTGFRNTGSFNTGDYNLTNYSTGFFNTEEQIIYFFNQPSDWTRIKWMESSAYRILKNMPFLDWMPKEEMTTAEKENYPEFEATGGYLKKANDGERQKWWDGLTNESKTTIKSLPNFNPKIFKQITGIDVEEKNEKDN